MPDQDKDLENGNKGNQSDDEKALNDDLPEKGKKPGSDEDGDDTAMGGKRDKDEKEHYVPKHRLDEEIAKRKELEESVNTLKNRFSQVGEALTGEKKSELQDEAVVALSKKYNVNENFVKDLFEVADKRAEEKFGKQVGSIKQGQAEMEYERDLMKLAKTIPDINDFSEEDSKKFRDMAFDPKYSRTPLEDVYKIFSYGKPTGNRKTFESGRSGGARRSDAEEKDISKMSLEEFEKFSNELGRKSQ